MPTQVSEPSTSTRRSSRLSKSSKQAIDVKGQDRDLASSRKKGRSKVVGSSKPYDKPSGSRRGITTRQDDVLSPSTPSSHLRRSLRISAEELVRREAALLTSEKEFDHKSAELHSALALLKQKEMEAARMMSRLADREAQDTLTQLEESFLCPLCYEVLSAPHTLNAPNCGHTFCGLCILKWFCSRMHGCGARHEQVYCPMCRAEIHPPDRRISFPFIPNRLATTTITGLAEKLSTIPANTAMLVKREENDDVLVSGSKTPQGRSCSRLSQQAKTEEDSDIPQTPDVDGWREGGLLRTEWLKKDREGRQEMSKLYDSWRSPRPQDFIALKNRLGV